MRHRVHFLQPFVAMPAPARVQRLRQYLEVLSPRRLAFLKLSDLLSAWAARPAIRRSRALRRFFQVVPPERVSLSDGIYRFAFPCAGRELTLGLRRDTSDVAVFLQIMVDREYQPVLGLLPAGARSLRIVDAGANIGLTTLFFKCVDPEARVVALEPEPGSRSRISAHMEENRVEGVTVLEAGLWTSEGRVAPDPAFRDGEAWSFALQLPRSSDEATIPTLTLAALLDRVGWDRADLVKVDVEGAEARLLRDAAFLQTVEERARLVAMEIHPEAISPVEAQAAFVSLGWRSVMAGETLLAWADD